MHFQRKSRKVAMPLFGTTFHPNFFDNWRVPERPSPLDAQCHICLSPSLAHDDFANTQVTKFVIVANGDEKCISKENRGKSPGRQFLARAMD
jgi:hypothetical protein